MDPVVHFEIPFTDLNKAKEFYKIFDWKIEEVPEMDYVMVYTTEMDENRMHKKSGAINGGLMKKDDTAPYPILVVSVISINESLEKVKNAGGAVVMETMPVGDMGLYARVKDTSGNIIGIWQDLKK